MHTRLVHNIQPLLNQHRHALSQSGAQLHALSPLRVLDRGYAIALDANNNAVRSIDQVKPQQPLRIRVHDGQIHTQITDVVAHSDEPSS